MAVSNRYNMTRQELGARIRARREYLGWTQTELARRVNVARETVTNWETARRGIDVTALPEIACALGVEIGYFYGEREYAPEDVPEVLKRVWGLQGKVVNAMPPGPVRDRYIRGLETVTESYLDLLKLSGDRDEAERKGEE